MKLFYAKETCALASHIALEEAGADYTLSKVDFASGEQRSSDYLAVNPKGRVPALVTDRGVLTENPVILGWIAETYRDAALAPFDDSFAFGEMQAFNLFLFRPERYADSEAAKADVRDKAPAAVADHFKLIESWLSDGRTWVHGEAYTVSDPYLFVFTRWLFREGFGDPKRFPRALAHMGRMNARAAVRSALAAQGDAPIEA